jgi:translation initiation factor eIF-2B subunit alpha
MLSSSAFYNLHQILTHSYSRVVMQTLLLAHKHKRISGAWKKIELDVKRTNIVIYCKVFVTEARPRGLGYENLIYPSHGGILTVDAQDKDC